MTVPIRGQERSYQRGLVLGLTLAEIMMLVLFIMLLVMASMAKRFADERADGQDPQRQVAMIAMLTAERDATRDALAELEAQAALERADLQRLRDELARVQTQELAVLKQQLQDLFTELEEARERRLSAETSRDELATLLAPVVAKLAERDALVRQLAPHGELESDKAMREAVQAMAAHATLAAALATAKQPPDRALATAVVEVVAAKAANWEKPVDPAALTAALDDAQRLADELPALERKLVELERQLEWYRQRSENDGKGVEMPSCWINDGGGVEYLFEVLIGEQGLLLRPTDLPRREPDRSLLPVAGIPLGQWLSPETYLAVTRPVFDWSVAKKCRFFVRIIDATPPSEKLLYKRRLQIAEQHFYKFLVGG